MTNIIFPDGVFADVRLEETHYCNIRSNEGKIESISEWTTTGVFLRVYKEGHWYTSSTSNLDTISAELAKLASSTALSPATNNGNIERLKVEKINEKIYTETRVDQIPTQDKIDILHSYSHLFEHELIKTWQASYSDNYSIKHYYSSVGADVEIDFQKASINYVFPMAHGTDTRIASYGCAENDFNKLMNLEQEIKTAVDDHVDFLLNAEDIEAGEYPVILAPMVAGVFAHESFGHKSEADFMLGDDSMLEAWKIGSRIGEPLLSIIDYGGIPGNGYIPYDDEGQKCHKNYLIKDGILTGRLHSADTAAELNEDITGNARALSFYYEPIVRMTSTWIDAGEQTKQELFEGIDNGYYIKTCAGGSGMSTFTIIPSLAYKIENGKITKPAKIAMMTGDVFSTLGEIDGLSDTLEWSKAVGACGKMEQSGLPVGMGGPYVRVKKMKLA